MIVIADTEANPREAWISAITIILEALRGTVFDADNYLGLVATHIASVLSCSHKPNPVINRNIL